ncbi:hypothetical protein [Desulfovibrio aminophilus]|uniref:hypothetical protein n=1 Tax=Desulfovibrio aminophilus TaxID=81425 RepID=UPI003390F27C
MTKNEISDRFKLNLDRVRNLVALYPAPGKGRRAVHHTDILRAAIVLLHATLEDLLRSYLIMSIENFSNDTMDSYGFHTEHKRVREKINISELLKYKGKTIDEFIIGSIQERIERYETFNDIGDVKNTLEKCGFPNPPVGNYNYTNMAKMIIRRHQIVHKADKNVVASGRGNHQTASVSAFMVNLYIQAVQNFKNYVAANW